MTGKTTGVTKQKSQNRWYLNIMSPNTKGEKFAWLDPTSIYINGNAFHDLLDDLMTDLEGVTCDVVGGLDAMGFVLGSALATRLGVGFCPSAKLANYASIPIALPFQTIPVARRIWKCVSLHSQLVQKSCLLING